MLPRHPHIQASETGDMLEMTCYRPFFCCGASPSASSRGQLGSRCAFYCQNTSSEQEAYIGPIEVNEITLAVQKIKNIACDVEKLRRQLEKTELGKYLGQSLQGKWKLHVSLGEK